MHLPRLMINKSLLNTQQAVVQRYSVREKISKNFKNIYMPTLFLSLQRHARCMAFSKLHTMVHGEAFRIITRQLLSRMYPCIHAGQVCGLSPGNHHQHPLFTLNM